MADRPGWVTDVGAGGGAIPVATQERGDDGIFTTTTADPGSAGTTLAVTANARFPGAGNYKVQVENEIMLVTAGQGTNSWTVTRGVDGTTAVAHAIGVGVSLVTAIQRVIPVSERDVTYMGMCASFRTPGRAATAQNVFSIFNAAGSAILVAVRRMSIQVDQTAVRLTVAPKALVARSTTAPTNGTALGKLPFDTALSSNASVAILGDASADGTSSATTLTSTPDATKGFAQYLQRENTLVGQADYPDNSMIPLLCADDPVILRASQGLLIHIIAAATTDNPATAHYQINCVWEEFVLP